MHLILSLEKSARSRYVAWRPRVRRLQSRIAAIGVTSKDIQENFRTEIKRTKSARWFRQGTYKSLIRDVWPLSVPAFRASRGCTEPDCMVATGLRCGLEATRDCVMFYIGRLDD